MLVFEHPGSALLHGCSVCKRPVATHEELLTYRNRAEPPPTVALSTAIPALSELLATNSLFGTILSPITQPTAHSASASAADLGSNISFGSGQRSVRIAGWGIVKAIVKFLQQYVPLAWIVCSLIYVYLVRNQISNDPADQPKRPPDETQELLKTPFLSNLGVSALRSAWVEPDPGVRTSMWEGFLTLIKGEPSFILRRLNADIDIPGRISRCVGHHTA